jgi:hypothetical protein
MNSTFDMSVYVYEVYLVSFNYRNAKLKTRQLFGS